MFKKMMLMAVSAAALLAFAIPAIAQADTLTETGVALKPGAGVTATSSNLTTKTANGTLACQKVTLHFEVVSNNPLVLAPVGTATTENCTLNNLPIVTITSGHVLSNLSLTNGEGSVTAEFVSDIFSSPAHSTLVAECEFEGNLNVKGTNGSGTINVGGILNGPCGEGEMTGAFTLETSGDFHPLTLDTTP